MPEKRPHPEATSLQNGANKRSSPNGDSLSKKVEEARARAEAIKAKQLEDAKAQARARVEAIKARLAGQGAPLPSQSGAPSSAAAKPKIDIEALKARVAAATGRAQSSASQVPGAPSASLQQPHPPQPEFEEPNKARGGLNIGLHPSLLADSGADGKGKGKAGMAPKFATTMANRRDAGKDKGKDKKQLDLSGPSMEELKQNPYFDTSLISQGGVTGKSRNSRQLVFNQKGKYIAQASALRRQAKLEEMKRRIYEQTRKAGVDEANEKAFLIPEPPAIEWWDEGMVAGNYEDMDSQGALKIISDDSIITVYVQHPVLIEPPQDKHMPTPKPMFLTKKEQAKMRRQRRMADHKEQQAKIRLGLEPPPPPKVKKSNLMRVLGEQAVKDPTAVEAMVNRQIAERAANHEASNETRKLTKEQKLEKLEKNQSEDAAKGILCSVYKIDDLSNGQHRFKIDMNAKQQNLTGITILHPKFNLVIVEGGSHSIAAYRKLMLNRIKWTENAMPSSVREGNREVEQAWLNALDEKGELKDLGVNKCQLIFEGEERDRVFRKWMTKVCESDADAKEILQRTKMEYMWAKAKSMP